MVEKSYLERIAKEEQQYEQILMLNCQIMARLSILNNHKLGKQDKIKLQTVESKMRQLIYGSNTTRIYFAGLKKRWGERSTCKDCPFSKCIYL